MPLRRVRLDAARCLPLSLLGSPLVVAGSAPLSVACVPRHHGGPLVSRWCLAASLVCSLAAPSPQVRRGPLSESNAAAYLCRPRARNRTLMPLAWPDRPQVKSEKQIVSVRMATDASVADFTPLVACLSTLIWSAALARARSPCWPHLLIALLCSALLCCVSSRLLSPAAVCLVVLPSALVAASCAA